VVVGGEVAAGVADLPVVPQAGGECVRLSASALEAAGLLRRQSERAATSRGERHASCGPQSHVGFGDRDPGRSRLRLPVLAAVVQM